MPNENEFQAWEKPSEDAPLKSFVRNIPHESVPGACEMLVEYEQC